jgi:hypothetical protein
VGAIIGGVIGGALFGAALVVLLYWIRKRATKSRTADRVANEQSEPPDYGTNPAAQNTSSATEAMEDRVEKDAPDV